MRSTALIGLVSALAATTTFACGDDGAGQPCAEEYAIGVWGRMTSSAINPAGHLVTVENTTIFTDLGPAVGANIRTLTSDGTISASSPLGGAHASEPLVDADGRVSVLHADLLHVFDGGFPIFSVPASNFMALLHDGTLLAGGPPLRPREVLRIDRGGFVILRKDVAEDGYLIARVAISGDGTVFALEIQRPGSDVSNRVRVLALTPGLDLKWAAELPLGGNPHLAADADGGVVAIVGDVVSAVDRSGRQRWRTQVESGIGPLSIGPDGTVYLSAGAIGSDGQLRWRSAPGQVISPFTVAADGTLYAMVSAPDPKRAGRVDDSYEFGVGVFDPATGALIDRVFGTPTRWWGSPVFGEGRCGANAGEHSFDGILFESSALWFTKPTPAPIAGPWGRASGDAANTNAAPIISAIPLTAADVRGFWVRDDGDERVTLELAETSGLDPALAGLRDVYVLWRTGSVTAGTIAQVGRYRIDGGTLVLERLGGASGGSTSELRASPWTKIDLVDPIAGGPPLTWQRTVAVAAPTDIEAHITNLVSAGKGQGGLAAYDPSDGIGWVVHLFSDSVRLNTTIAANGPSDLLIYRVDASKDEIVEAGFGSNGAEVLPHDVVVDGAGDLHLVGSMPSWRDNAQQVHHIRVRRDLSGFDELTLPEAPGTGPVELMAVDRLPSGGVIAVGWQGNDVVIVRFDAGGAITEDHRFLSPGPQGATAVAVDAAGRVTVAGFLTGRLDFGDGVVLDPMSDPDVDPNGFEGIFIVRFGADGRAEWGRYFADLTVTAALRLELVAWDDGSFALGGPLPSGVNRPLLSFGLGPMLNDFADPMRPNFEPEDGFLVRFAVDGTPVNQAQLATKTLAGIAAAPGGLVVATGRSSEDVFDPWLASAYDSCGRELWRVASDCASCVFGDGVAVAPDGRMLVTATNYEKAKLDGQILLGGQTAVALYFDPLIELPAGATMPPPGVCPTVVLPTLDVSVVLEGSASGRVVSDPPGIDCPGQCRAPFEVPGRVVLTATAGPDGRFDGWGAPCAGTRGPCTLRLSTTEQAVVARFEPPALAWQRVIERRDATVGVELVALETNADGQTVVALQLAGSGSLSVADGVVWQAPGLGWVALAPDGTQRWASFDPSITTGSVRRMSVAPNGACATMVVVGAQTVEGTRILRHDADGNPLPEVALPADPIWWVQDLTHTANNELLMVSDTPHPDDPTQRIATVTRFAADGMQSSVEVPGGVNPTAIAAADNGDIVLAFSHRAAVTFGGETLPASGGGNAIGIARLSASGDLRWMRGLGFGDVRSMGRAGDGFVVNMLSGENWDEPLGGIPGLAPRQTSQVVMKLGGDGAARWWRAPGVLGAMVIVASPNGGFAWVEGVPDQPFDQIVRFDDNGQPAAWSLPVPTGTLIAVDGQGAVLLGTSVPDGGDLGFGTIERGGVAFLKVGP